MIDKVRLQEALAELQAYKRLTKEMAVYIETSTRDVRHPMVQELLVRYEKLATGR